MEDAIDEVNAEYLDLLIALAGDRVLGVSTLSQTRPITRHQHQGNP